MPRTDGTNVAKVAGRVVAARDAILDRSQDAAARAAKDTPPPPAERPKDDGR